jgi:pSer/pThr/pTyr-binding forkhead associated (FHA) protein
MIVVRGIEDCTRWFTRNFCPSCVAANVLELSVMLNEGENILGREARDTIRLSGATVSRRHARIVVTGDEATVEDLGSKNGTYLGGERLTAPARICDGDRLLIGAVPLVFRVHRAAESTLTRPAAEDRPIPSKARAVQSRTSE